MNQQQQTKLYHYNVVRIEALTDTILQVFAEPQSDKDKLDYQAGQYIEIHLDGQARPFSIANAPLGSGRLEFHLRHSLDNDFINQLFSQLEKSNELIISGPLGNCTFPDNDKPILFIAGGTGFAPYKALIEYALAKHKSNPVHLVWGANNLSDLYLHSIAEKWQQHIEHFDYLPSLLSAPSDGHWQGNIGYVTDVIKDRFADGDAIKHFSIYIAGPFEMIEQTKKTLCNLGAERSQIFTDI